LGNPESKSEKGGEKKMKIERISFKKSAKFLMLLVSSFIIATASAAIYYTITMQPKVAITSAVIKFVEGNDWPSSSTMGTNGTWVRLSLKAYPNATLTYDQPLNISNTDTVQHQFRLRHVSITPASGTASVSNFTSISFVIKDASGTTQGSFTYTTTGDAWNTPATTSYFTLPADTQWIIYVETKAAAGASSGIEANIEIAVDVLE
jgi:hypothetical protein